MPKAVPRSLPVNAWAIRANEVANMMAPPIPWAPRARFNMSDVDEMPQITDAAVNRATPTAKMRLRPTMSPITPAVRRKAARGERVGVDHPLEVGEGRVEVGLNGRERHVDHGDVQQQHEDAHAHRRQRPPLAVHESVPRSMGRLLVRVLPWKVLPWCLPHPGARCAAEPVTDDSAVSERPRHLGSKCRPAKDPSRRTGTASDASTWRWLRGQRRSFRHV